MDAWTVVTLAATIIVAMLAGGVGLALFVGKAIHDVAKASAFLNPSSASVDSSTRAEEAFRRAESEAADALLALQEASRGPLAASQIPTDAPPAASTYGAPEASVEARRRTSGPQGAKSACRPCQAARNFLKKILA